MGQNTRPSSKSLGYRGRVGEGLHVDRHAQPRTLPTNAMFSSPGNDRNRALRPRTPPGRWTRGDRRDVKIAGGSRRLVVRPAVAGYVFVPPALSTVAAGLRHRIPRGDGGSTMKRLERVRDNCSGYFALWTRDLRRRRRYTYVRHELARQGFSRGAAQACSQGRDPSWMHTSYVP